MHCQWYLWHVQGRRDKSRTRTKEESNYVKGDQSKEERQTEIAAMEKEISGLIRNERTDVLDSKADRFAEALPRLHRRQST